MAKGGKHDGGSSITESSHTPEGSPGKPYKSGANVSKGSKPAPGKGGVAPVATSKKGKSY